MKQVVITVGAPGSGKTTWMKKYIRDKVQNKDFTFLHCNRDEIRNILTGGLYDEGKYAFDKEGHVTSIQNAIFNRVIWSADLHWYLNSDTNLNLKLLREFLKRCEDNAMGVNFAAFPTLLSTLVSRNEERVSRGERSVPIDAIERMHAQTREVFEFIDTKTREKEHWVKIQTG